MAGKTDDDRVLPINDRTVNAAKAKGPRGTEYQIAADPGFKLFVTAAGVGTYFYRYDDKRGRDRVQNRIKIGRRDEITLASARKRANDLRAKVGAGEDPREAAEARKTALTFKELFEERMRLDSDRAQTTLANYDEVLKREVFPTLGNLVADEITSAKFAGVLRMIKSEHSAHRARSAIGSTYRWARKRELVSGNPTIGLGFTKKSEPRKRLLSPDELRTLWLGMDREDVSISEAVKTIVRLAILTGQRRAEVTGTSASELTLDDDRPLWRIPAARMKRKSAEQVVPLSREAAALFRNAMTEARDGFVFPSDKRRVRLGVVPKFPHIDPHSISTAMRRLTDKLGIDDAHVHDARKVLATWLRQVHKARADVLDAVLHHAARGVTNTHYNFADLEEPVRQALQAWADHVTKITAASPQQVSREPGK